jgi:hypothetical protein
MTLFNTEPLTCLGCPLNAVLHVLSKPGSQSAETPSLLQMHIFNLSIISIALLDKRVPDAGLQKRATFSALNVGPVGPGPPAWQAAAQTTQPSTEFLLVRQHRDWGLTCLRQLVKLF